MVVWLGFCVTMSAYVVYGDGMVREHRRVEHYLSCDTQFINNTVSMVFAYCRG
jgi:hypothetical protein